MADTLEQKINWLIGSGQQSLICNGLRGIEKESLRVTPCMAIALTPHHPKIGSALTHPYITTDFSEALLEMVTPPFTDTPEALRFLDELHRFVYPHLDEELLLATSMPCGISGDDSVPIADYGPSNIGMMKHIYRKGLGYRYGRAMQAISGIHFNYSIPQTFWPVLQEFEQDRQPLTAYIAERYFDLIRNLHRVGWIIPFLFGASPAVCKSFLDSRQQFSSKHLQEYDSVTLYTPYATSLRMSDIGYKNSRQAGLNISFNSLEEYVVGLSAATQTSHPHYEGLGVKINGEYNQLNTSILQIENEYYNSLRPKQIAESNENSILALKRRGVKYIEIRSLDVNPFEPNGISETQLRFVEALILRCLLKHSPKIAAKEKRAIKENSLTVAYNGRKPGLMLYRNDQQVLLKSWVIELCQQLRGICEMLDTKTISNPYTRALDLQFHAIADYDRLPSSQILTQMQGSNQSFTMFAAQLTRQHKKFFRGHPLPQQRQQIFELEAQRSVQRQKDLEESDIMSFDQFLWNLGCQFGYSRRDHEDSLLEA